MSTLGWIGHAVIERLGSVSGSQNHACFFCCCASGCLQSRVKRGAYNRGVALLKYCDIVKVQLTK